MLVAAIEELADREAVFAAARATLLVALDLTIMLEGVRMK